MKGKTRCTILGVVLSLIGAISVTKGVSNHEMFAYILGFFLVFGGVFYFFELAKNDLS